MRKKRITTIEHPDYRAFSSDWTRWRLTYEGGRAFIFQYLVRYSKREEQGEFEFRRDITYCPAFAAAALDEVKNAIFQRMTDISRVGGSVSYNAAVNANDQNGKVYGVDMLGKSMNNFIGGHCLIELLLMGKVGVYVDMPPKPEGTTLRDDANRRPYCYMYKAEDIRSWARDIPGEPNQFSSLLLRDTIYQTDSSSSLPIGTTYRYRHFKVLSDNTVSCQFYDKNDNPTDVNGVTQSVPTPVILNIPRIPFVLFELSNSLMSSICEYQIALLQLASTDISYLVKANFSFYVEQFDPAGETFLRAAGQRDVNFDAQGQLVAGAQTGTAADAAKNKEQEIKVGATQGRRYAKGLNQPAFINPDTDPIRASMEKQNQLKEEIRTLVALALSNVKPKMASAESKQLDQQGLEAGLSYVGLELENGERRIAQFWAMYEKSDPATVNYPERYSLKSEEERRKEAKELAELMNRVPSMEYKRQILKKIVEILIGHTSTEEQLIKIYKEIDEAKVLETDPEVISKDIEQGVLPLEYAAEAKGYPEDSTKKAAGEHAARLARIAKSQESKTDGAARGVKDLGGKTSSEEKVDSKDTTDDDVVTSKQRGEGQ